MSWNRKTQVSSTLFVDKIAGGITHSHIRFTNASWSTLMIVFACKYNITEQYIHYDKWNFEALSFVCFDPIVIYKLQYIVVFIWELLMSQNIWWLISCQNGHEFHMKHLYHESMKLAMCYCHDFRFISHIHVNNNILFLGV